MSVKKLKKKYWTYGTSPKNNNQIIMHIYLDVFTITMNQYSMNLKNK